VSCFIPNWVHWDLELDNLVVLLGNLVVVDNSVVVVVDNFVRVAVDNFVLVVVENSEDKAVEGQRNWSAVVAGIVAVVVAGSVAAAAVVEEQMGRIVADRSKTGEGGCCARARRLSLKLFEVVHLE